MQTLVAQSDETLVDFFMRIRDETRRTDCDVQCADLEGSRFLITPNMTTAEVVRAWFDARSTARTSLSKST
jgi:hypothetical protein